MGKRLIQQRRGKGTSTFKSPSFRFAGRAKYGPDFDEPITGKVVDLIHSSGHNAPLMQIELENGYELLLIAPEGISVGEEIQFGNDVEVKTGNVLPVGEIPEGTKIFNLERRFQDGGKFVRSSGSVARVVAQMGDTVVIRLPSKKEIELNPKCRATIGVVAGGGRVEKPFMKAGNKFKAMRSKNNRYPRVSGVSMNAGNHPFGGTSSHKKGRPTIAPKNAPPGKKAGKIRPSRTGKKR